MPDIEIGELRRDELPAAGALLGRAYRDNPFVFVRFGDDPDHRLQAMECIHRARVSAMEPPAIVARRAGRLVGVCGADPPGGSEMAPADLHEMLQTLSRLSPSYVRDREMRRAESRKSEPAVPHWHLGPVGVDVDAQGEGIGTLMIKRFCERMDNAGDIAFLGTDVPANVRLYERFGFVITEEATRLGVHGWSMLRRPNM
jgi:ribosomal protein S18 acetylase RimI-like enzyme